MNEGLKTSKKNCNCEKSCEDGKSQVKTMVEDVKKKTEKFTEVDNDRKKQE